MAQREPENLYGDFGSVPKAEPTTTGGGIPLSVRATPEDFGAQVGKAKEQFGSALQGVGKDLSTLGETYSGIVAETSANNALTKQIENNNNRRADLLSSEGQDAVNKFPAYQQGVTDDFNTLRSSLDPRAQRIFDNMGRRQVATYLSEGTSYAATQGKQALFDSNTQLGDAHIKSMLTPAVAANPQSVYEAGAAIQYAHQPSAATPNTVQDPDSGDFKWADTPEGKGTKAVFEAKQGEVMGNMVSTAVTTVAKQDPIKASQMLDQYKSMIPPSYQASLSAALAQPVFDQHLQVGTQQFKMGLHSDYNEALTNPAPKLGPSVSDAFFQQESSGGSAKYNNIVGAGNVAVGPMQITPDTWNTWKGLGIVKQGEAIDNPAQNEAVGRRAVNYYLDQYKDDPQQIQKSAVAYHSGPGNVSPLGSPTAYINNTVDDLGKHTADYVSDIQGRITGMGAQPVGQGSIPGAPPQNYGRNADGGMITPADYAVAHRFDLIQNARVWARQQMPGNLKFENAMAERANGYITQLSSDQTATDHQVMAQVYKGISGGLSKDGSPPKDYDELMAIPGMKEGVAYLSTRDVNTMNFANNIPTMQAKQQRNPDNPNQGNSPNFYHSAQLFFQNKGFQTENELHGAMGRNDETGINLPDYKALSYLQTQLGSDASLKASFSDEMSAIAHAGGNIDGKGEERASAFLNTAIKAFKDNSTKDSPMSNSDLFNELKDNVAVLKPGIMSQISNILKSQPTVLPGGMVGSQENSNPPSAQVSAPETPNTGKVMVMDGSGKKFMLPENQLEEAEKSGYKKVE